MFLHNITGYTCFFARYKTPGWRSWTGPSPWPGFTDAGVSSELSGSCRVLSRLCRGFASTPAKVRAFDQSARRQIVRLGRARGGGGVVEKLKNVRFFHNESRFFTRYLQAGLGYCSGSRSRIHRSADQGIVVDQETDRRRGLR